MAKKTTADRFTIPAPKPETARIPAPTPHPHTDPPHPEKEMQQWRVPASTPAPEPPEPPAPETKRGPGRKGKFSDAIDEGVKHVTPHEDEKMIKYAQRLLNWCQENGMLREFADDLKNWEKNEFGSFYQGVSGRIKGKAKKTEPTTLQPSRPTATIVNAEPTVSEIKEAVRLAESLGGVKALYQHLQLIERIRDQFTGGIDRLRRCLEDYADLTGVALDDSDDYDSDDETE